MRAGVVDERTNRRGWAWWRSARKTRHRRACGSQRRRRAPRAARRSHASLPTAAPPSAHRRRREALELLELAFPPAVSLRAPEQEGVAGAGLPSRRVPPLAEAGQICVAGIAEDGRQSACTRKSNSCGPGV